MIAPIVHSDRPVTLVGAGQATSESLEKALRIAPTCVAADGGARLALENNVPLAAVIGDFDSVDPSDLAGLPQALCHRIAEQESTDFEKALTRIAAPLVLGLGFTGGRIDHQLAALHTLLAFPHRPCVLMSEQELICLAPPRLALPTARNDVVSLFPMGQVTGQSEGLTWPIDGLSFSPMTRVGTSNRAEGPMTLRFSAPRMLLILPERLMPELVQALVQPDAARWPAPAG